VPGGAQREILWSEAFFPKNFLICKFFNFAVLEKRKNLKMLQQIKKFLQIF